MRLTRKACYGIRALHYIVETQSNGRYCPVEEIGRAQDIPCRFLSKVVQDLVRAGLVVSRRGRDGGVRLARPAAQITIFDVVQALEGPLAISECLLPEPPQCPRMETCQLRQVWKEMQMMIASHLDSVNLETAQLVHEELR